MVLDDALRSRRSVRGFLPRAISAQTFREVLELAQLAPSNCNAQPWLVHVVSGAKLEQLRDELVRAASAGVATNPDFPADAKRFTGIHRARQIDAAVQLYESMEIARHDAVGRKHAYAQNYAFFNAPHAIFIFIESYLGAREIHDMGMYGQTLLLALASRGIASCAQGALGEYPDIVRSHLGVPPQHRLMYGISIGYEDVAVKANDTRVGRAPIEDVVRFHE